VNLPHIPCETTNLAVAGTVPVRLEYGYKSPPAPGDAGVRCAGPLSANRDRGVAGRATNGRCQCRGPCSAHDLLDGRGALGALKPVAHPLPRAFVLAHAGREPYA
jgi:hypothetical protein